MENGDSTVPVKAAVIYFPELKAQLGVCVDHDGAHKFVHTTDACWYTLRSMIIIAQQVNNPRPAYNDVY